MTDLTVALQMLNCPDIKEKATGQAYTLLSVNVNKDGVFTPINGRGDSGVIKNFEGFEILGRKKQCPEK